MTTTPARPPFRRVRDLPWLAMIIVTSAVLVSVLGWVLCAALLDATDEVVRSTGQLAELRSQVSRACADGSATGSLCTTAPGR